MAGNTGWGHSSPRHLIWGWSANEVALVGVEDAGVLTTVGHLSESHLLSHGARHRWGPHLSLPCRNGPASAHGLSPQCARSIQNLCSEKLGQNECEILRTGPGIS